MESYYSSPSYYYEPSCPVHDSYVDPYSTYPSYYYPSYIDQSSPQVAHYNNSTTNTYAQPTPPSQVIPSTPILNTTFESSKNVLLVMTFIIC